MACKYCQRGMERGVGGGRMGVFPMGESSHPISGAIERGEIHAARRRRRVRTANLIRPIAIEKVKGDE